MDLTEKCFTILLKRCKSKSLLSVQCFIHKWDTANNTLNDVPVWMNKKDIKEYMWNGDNVKSKEHKYYIRQKETINHRHKLNYEHNKKAIIT